MLLRSQRASWQHTWFTDTPHRKLHASFTSVHNYHFSQSWLLVGGSDWSRRVRLIDAGAGRGDPAAAHGIYQPENLPRHRGTQFWSSLPFDHFSNLHTLFYFGPTDYFAFTLVFLLLFTLRYLKNRPFLNPHAWNPSCQPNLFWKPWLHVKGWKPARNREVGDDEPLNGTLTLSQVPIMYVTHRKSQQGCNFLLYLP